MALTGKSPRALIQDLLEKKAKLKQDIFEDTKKQFEQFKIHIQHEIQNLRTSVIDERVRLYTVDKGGLEIQVFMGSDVIVYHMHTNVFKLPDEHPMWKLDYLKNDKSRGYFGIINIYNFLADSYLNNRLNDIGYLIGRIFINCDGYFIVEGKGKLGTIYSKISKSEMNEKNICQIIHVSLLYALEFDLLTPPYEIVAKASVSQMLEHNSRDRLPTDKRMGFKFENDKNMEF